MSFGYQILGFGAFPRVTTYTVQRSLVFNREEDVYLSRTISGSSTGNTKGTFSTWIKRTVLGTAAQGIFAANNGTAGASGGHDHIGFTSNDQINWYIGAGEDDITWAPRFRDTSAFYNFVVAMDTTQSTDTDRVKLYVNGTLVTEYQAAAHPAEDQVFRGFAYASGTTYQVIGTDTTHNSTSSRNEAGYYLGGDVIYVDGLALEPTAFGKTDTATGIWVPIQPKVTEYGNHGFRLEFKGTDVGTDTSGKSNNWTANTSLGTNSVKPDTATNDTTTEVILYPALEHKGGYDAAGTMALSNGALTGTPNDNNAHARYLNIAINKADTTKYYFEISCGSGNDFGAMFVNEEITRTTTGRGQANTWTGAIESTTELRWWEENGNSSLGYKPTIQTYDYSNDRLCFAIDGNNDKIWVGHYDNSAGSTTWANNSTGSPGMDADPTDASDAGTLSFDFTTSTGSMYIALYQSNGSGRAATMHLNSTSWSGTVPTGYSAITKTLTGVGNYCTWNALQYKGNNDNSPVPVFSEGNTRIKNTSAVGACSFVGTVKMKGSGKFYWEVTCNATSTGVTDGYPYIGIIRDDEPPSFPNTFVAVANTYGSQQGYAVDNTGSKWISGTETTSFMSSYAAGVTISIALDLDNGKIWFARNGVYPSSGDPAGGSNEAYSSISTSFGWFPHSTE